MISNIEKPLKVNSTLSTLLTELGQECETVLFLLSQLKLSTLTDDQKGDILAELTGAICHLHVHTEDLPELIEDEILALPEPVEEQA
jgi:hypothetical protein